jgi:DASS family divalent anion:Na+ symporter
MNLMNILKKTNNNHIIFLLLILGTTLWFIPQPEGLTIKAWHLLIVFFITILTIMTNTFALGVITLLSTAFCITFHLIPLDHALSGFGSNIVWFVVFAFFIARGLIKTGLGNRVAYFFMSKFGKSTLGLSYGLVLTELILAPVIPSASARGGSIILPIIESLTNKYAEQYGNHREKHKKQIGEFLTLLCFHTNVITSAMFLTAMAANPITAKLALLKGISISWNDWAIGAFVPGLLCLVIFPIILNIICSPGISYGDTAPKLAKEALKSMGKLTSKETIMIFTFLFLLALWSAEKYLQINATTTAMIGLVILLITKVLTWNDILSEKSAWDTFIWFAILIMLADSLNLIGITKWMDVKMHDVIVRIDSKIIIIVFSCICFFYIHYVFASITARVTVTYTTFLVTFLNIGLPPLPSALGLGYLSVLSAGLTHYGIGSAPIFFGAGYSTTSRWWKKSFIIASINLFVWSFFSLIWWKILGWY